jgi:hypothetical protein
MMPDAINQSIAHQSNKEGRHARKHERDEREGFELRMPHDLMDVLRPLRAGFDLAAGDSHLSV